MAKKKNRRDDERRADDARVADDSARGDDRESGMPGGGRGRRDAVGRSGVYPESASERPSADAPVRNQNAWGQGERGAGLCLAAEALDRLAEAALDAAVGQGRDHRHRLEVAQVHQRGAAGYEDSGSSELASSEEIRRRIERDRQSASQHSSDEERSGERQRSPDGGDQRSRGDQHSRSDQRSRGDQRSR